MAVIFITEVTRNLETSRGSERGVMPFRPRFMNYFGANLRLDDNYHCSISIFVTYIKNTVLALPVSSILAYTDSYNTL